MPWLLAVPGLAALLLFHFVPIAFGGYFAFTDWDGLTHASWVGLENFRDILGDAAARGALSAHARARRLLRRARERDRPGARARPEPGGEDAALPAACCSSLPVVLSPLAISLHLAVDLRLRRRAEPGARRRRARVVEARVDRRSLDRALDDPRRHGLAVLRARDGALPRRPPGDLRRGVRGDARRRRVRLVPLPQGRAAAARARDHRQRRRSR